MAVANLTITDTKYRTTVKTDITGTNSAASILDESTLSGHVAGDLLNLAKITWSLSSQTDVFWDATTDVVAISMNGTGSYGFMPGQPALPNNAAVANRTGDVKLTNAAACVGTVVVEYHKVIDAGGKGWSA